MATAVKEKGSGSSSSSATDKMKKNTSQTKKTPTKTPLSSSSSSDPKSQKPIPNYLRPTISSSHISTKPAATIRKTHPIEKPPLPSQVNKAQIPKPNPPQRSVSSLSSRITKTGAVPTMRRSISAKGSSSSKKVATKTGHKGVTQPESRVDDVSHDEAPLDHVIDGEVEDGAHNDEQQATQSDHDPATETKEQSHDQTLEEAQEAAHEELPVVNTMTETEGLGLVEDHVEDEKVDDKKDETVELEVEASMEGSKEEDQVKEAQDYNEVIEETATKLMKDNTNKVRALAGAFETVISLQDTK